MSTKLRSMVQVEFAPTVVICREFGSQVFPMYIFSVKRMKTNVNIHLTQNQTIGRVWWCPIQFLYEVCFEFGIYFYVMESSNFLSVYVSWCIKSRVCIA